MNATRTRPFLTLAGAAFAGALGALGATAVAFRSLEAGLAAAAAGGIATMLIVVVGLERAPR
jgi:hypothetical protein